MTDSSGSRVWLIAAIIVGLFVAVAYIVHDSDDQSELVEKLSRKLDSPASVIPKSEQPTDVVRVTSTVVAQKDVLPGSWVLQKEDKPRPRLILPFESLEDGPSASRTPREVSAEHANEEGFLGADACADCHQTRHSGFLLTAHHRTSSVATQNRILGSLESPDNQLTTSDPDLSVTMHSKEDSVVQKVSLADWSVDVPMDVITGSGKVAQTFLYWDEDRLFQSFASYFSGADRWLTSPGFEDLDANFGRVIRTECLECHVTYIEQTEPPNHYQPSSAVWGISCERCHGPGKSHVEYHIANPEFKTAEHIVHPNELPRERQLDICGQCHSGSFDFKKPAFSFRPGDDLSEFHHTLKPDFDDSGIHTSNQLARLRKSECFLNSEMTCTACHDPHVAQRGDEAFFRQACLNCHETEHCGMRPELPVSIADQCVQCHMPSTQIDDLAGMKLQGLTLSMADHYIRVDREHAKKIKDQTTDSSK
ncbi:multiheme c-type cytochrome [Rhodopirellula baltica]|uniref:multiheme c-type cytochrome n=1 Tax=Rhodopirellula baltica TaxID=265606 RepID=UPI0002DFCA37|nr:multiheme c-type cytochrome [Rhodopirellula baltica]